MNHKQFLTATVLLFLAVLVLVFLGVVFLLPGYLSLREGPFRNAGAASIRIRSIAPGENNANEAVATSTEVTPPRE